LRLAWQASSKYERSSSLKKRTRPRGSLGLLALRIGEASNYPYSLYSYRKSVAQSCHVAHYSSIGSWLLFTLGKLLTVFSQQSLGNICQCSLAKLRFPLIELEGLHVDGRGTFSRQDFP